MSMFYLPGVNVNANANVNANVNASVGDQDADLQALDFSDADALRKAHQTLVEQGPPARWKEVLLVAPLSTQCLAALATLHLLRFAATAQQSSTKIPGDLEQAAKTVAEHLSPTGQAELLQSLDANAADDPFAQYLTDRDRRCVAAHVYVIRGKAGCVALLNGAPAEDAGKQAEKDYRQAVTLYLDAGYSHQAGVALRQFGDVTRAIAADLEQAKQPAKATYQRALGAYLDLADIHQGAAQTKDAARARMDAAFVYEKLGRLPEAVHCYTEAEQVCNEADLPDLARDARARADMVNEAALAAPIDEKEQCNRMEQSVQAAALLRKAEDDHRAGQVNLAREAYGEAAEIYKALENWEGAALAFWNADKFAEAGPLFKLANNHISAGDAFAVVGSRMEQKGDFKQAIAFYSEAATAYEAGGMSALQEQYENIVGQMKNRLENEMKGAEDKPPAKS
ncbi:hypothetical protein [Pandoraea sputorum]|uniref:Tetratricopeptide repeat protein n=1 Tax=Pandoraea sputorum TaxID=93222 RepID=A0A5E5BDZ0_9BURK|nr:hypothetical protein [Pandoraea sputorum]VVE84421.1 hypothetical protein PSP31121_04754 [Pandoraea sputorum]